MTGPPDDIEEADPGLARERTDLAWTRTAISFAAVGVAVLKNHPFAALPILAIAALIWRLGRLARRSGEVTRGQPLRLLAITIAIAGISVASLTIALLSNGPSWLRP